MKEKMTFEKDFTDSIITFDEMVEIAEREIKKIDAMFEHDKKLGYITLNVAYPYHIALDRIPNFEALLQWVFHLTGKNWMTGVLVHHFIKKVCEIKNWNLYGRSY